MFKGIWEAIKANKKGIITKALVGAGMLIGTALLSNNICEDDSVEIVDTENGFEVRNADTDENSEEE